MLRSRLLIFIITLACLLAGTRTFAAVSETAGGSLSALVVFARFQGESPRQTTKPTWADDLFNPARPGSFSHFYNEMSRGQLQVGGRVLPRRYASRQPASAYVAARPGQQGQYGQFNLEILEQVDADADLGEFDNDGPDRVPNSGDDDGYVDVVFINLLTVPEGFFIGRATGFASLGLNDDYLSGDPAAGGGRIRIRGKSSGFGGTTQRGHIFTVTAATMCHEFGHVLGLVDLFDQSSVSASGEIEPEEDSAGIGKWGLMGLGTLGWGIEDGPNAFCAWSLMRLGWIGHDNEHLVEVSESLRGVVIEQIDRGGKVYKIPISPDEYFLLANRQSTGSYYNRGIPQAGLLLWHVDERADNDEETHKQVDLVCADGLYADRGYPGERPDPVSGRDNLDFWSRDTAYASAHNGNQGDATDPFDGVAFTRFGPDTNPGARVHTGARRNLTMGFALESIEALADGRMRVDILVRQPLAGHITADTTWAGRVAVAGDIVVEPGATLTLAAGTDVQFGRPDSRESGFDPQRCELLVYGELVVEGDASTPVALRSGLSRPRPGDWLGVFAMASGDPDLEDQLRSGALVIQHAQFGLVRSRLPAGTTTWSGQIRIPWDVVVPAGSRLVLDPGTTVLFAPSDLSGAGDYPQFAELVVEGDLTVRGAAGRAVILTVDAFGQEAYWYGIRMRPGSTVAADFLEISRCGVGVSGTVAADRTLRLADCKIAGTAVGLSLSLFGEAVVIRTALTETLTRGILAVGTGTLRVSDSTIAGNGYQGISLGGCSLHASGTRIEGNGGRDPENYRSGLEGTGGPEQEIDLRDCIVAGNALDGLSLSDWEGVVHLGATAIRANRRHGIEIGRTPSLEMVGGEIVGNSGTGMVATNSTIEIRGVGFGDNEAAGLTLRHGSTGVVSESSFRGPGGSLKLEGVTDLVIRANTFEGGSPGMSSLDSSPSLLRNYFEHNATALAVSGTREPREIAANAFIDNDTAIDNQTTRLLKAEANYWGTVDIDAIAALMKGRVDWEPFLEQEPSTAVAEREGAGPLRFALHESFPNPFNGAVAIPFDLPSETVVTLVVYDAAGRRVRTVAEEKLPGGRYVRQWDGLDEDGRHVASGAYLYQLVTGGRSATGKMTLIK